MRMRVSSATIFKTIFNTIITYPIKRQKPSHSKTLLQKPEQSLAMWVFLQKVFSLVPL